MHDTATRVETWLREQALPLWAGVGLDAQHGFVERLSLDGIPDLEAPKRLRVQARQIYVYSHAALLGLVSDESSAANGYEFVRRHGCPEGVEAGFVHSLGRTGAIIDDRRDSYDHAFLLFAFSWYYRASGREEVKAIVSALGRTIVARLRHARSPGFVVDNRTAEPLHQNPHMHLLEAFLAAFDATEDSFFLDQATGLFDLFQTRMFDRDRGILREFYDGDWRPATGEAGRIVEPGHHCEWIWLLHWYAGRLGAPLCGEAQRLADFVERHGRAPDRLRLYDEVWEDGRVKKSSTRSWPQTEALKAEIALAEARGEVIGDRADAIVTAIFRNYLDPAIPGGWIDWIDASGAALVERMPASTFYHLFLAFSEYLRARTRAGDD
jgi:mannose/cellobiose epimerase-like protein (N-acyl-D-glucosamine 2-epimerase family)